MNIYDAVMKGPPKWFIRAVIILAILTIGVQVGLYKERSTQTARAIREQLAAKDRHIDELKIVLSAVHFDLEVEREKLSILTCESGIRHEGIWGDGGRSYGIAQFQYATFKDLRTQAGRPALAWKNMRDQLWLLDWALRHGYGRYWTCYGKTKPKGTRHES